MNIQVGKYHLIDAREIDYRDPRGIVWMWEEPKPRATYVVSCDPSYGIAGWERSLRTENDEKIDNCGVTVLRCGNPVVQVAEYAAPIDAEDAAAVVNFLGRIYAGNSDDEMARCIVEVQPGPGLLTQRELINRFGYLNLFEWQYLDSMNVKPTASFGWYSSRQSRQMLWIRGTRAIKQGNVIINSPWLCEEMADAAPDAFLNFTARAKWGCHDDRLLALLMGIWAANEWSLENPPEEAAKPEVPKPDYQHSDISIERMYDDWDDRFDTLLNS